LSALPASLVVLSRAECELCEAMLEDLAALGNVLELPPLAVVDVDSDAELARRYGLKVPVLLLDRSPVCHFKLDKSALLRVLRRAVAQPGIIPG
jgi:hypothetical protein